MHGSEQMLVKLPSRNFSHPGPKRVLERYETRICKGPWEMLWRIVRALDCMTLLDKLGVWWCLRFHNSLYHPFNSQVRCRTCHRTRPVEWHQSVVAARISDHTSALKIESGRTLGKVQGQHWPSIPSTCVPHTVHSENSEKDRKTEQAVTDVPSEQLPPAEDEHKPDLLEQLALDELLVASIAVANYRRGKATQ